jgi:aristolochene synthase
MLRYLISFTASAVKLPFFPHSLGAARVLPIEQDKKRMPTLVKDLPPPSKFHPSVHPHVDSVAAELDDYFLRNWPFRSEKERAKFRAAGFSRVTCLYFPLAMDDRIGFACRLLTVLFLIDGRYHLTQPWNLIVVIVSNPRSKDLLEEMGLDEGSEYNEKLISISRGEIPPDRNIPVEWIMHDLWEDVKACDAVLGEQIMEPVFTFMRAQTDKSRLAIHQLGEYLEYREKDVGQAYVLYIFPARVIFKLKMLLN